VNVRNLTRITNAGLLAGVGMGSGHLLMPARAGAVISRVVFVATMAGTGALAGWRERRARELDGDENVPGAQPLWIAGGAVLAILLAWIAYRVAHG
jgi:membrane protease YdiL (CAAX protease family)